MRKEVENLTYKEDAPTFWLIDGEKKCFSVEETSFQTNAEHQNSKDKQTAQKARRKMCTYDFGLKRPL